MDTHKYDCVAPGTCRCGDGPDSPAHGPTREEIEGVTKQRQHDAEENEFKAQAGRDMMTLDEHDMLDYYGRR